MLCSTFTSSCFAAPYLVHDFAGNVIRKVHVLFEITNRQSVDSLRHGLARRSHFSLHYSAALAIFCLFLRYHSSLDSMKHNKAISRNAALNLHNWCPLMKLSSRIWKVSCQGPEVQRHGCCETSKCLFVKQKTKLFIELSVGRKDKSGRGGTIRML